MAVDASELNLISWQRTPCERSTAWQDLVDRDWSPGRAPSATDEGDMLWDTPVDEGASFAVFSVAETEVSVGLFL